jgi:hypothetical protein
MEAFPKYHYLLTYLLTPWNRVLLEKLTGFAASQEIPRIYGTRKFITALTSARHSKVTFPDGNSDVTELLALLTFKFFPLCESFHRSKIFAI